MIQRFEDSKEVDDFVEALNYMLIEMVQAYAAGDPSWDQIGDSIILNVEHLATAAKAGMEK